MSFDELSEVMPRVNIMKIISNAVESILYIEDFDLFISDDEIIFLINMNTEIRITISCIENNIKYNEDNSLIIINMINSQIIMSVRRKDISE